MSEIPHFNPDPELEELLDEDLTQLDFNTLLDVQLYKSKKLQAKRDAGVSDAQPGWTMLKPDKVTDSDGKSTTNDTDPTPQRDSDEPSQQHEQSEEQEPKPSDGQIGFYNTLKSDLETQGPEDQKTASTAPSNSEPHSGEESSSPSSVTPGKNSEPMDSPGHAKSVPRSQLAEKMLARIIHESLAFMNYSSLRDSRHA